MSNKIDSFLDRKNKYFRQLRDKLFLPIIKIFHKIGLTANLISLYKIISVIIYLLLIKSDLKLAIYFLISGIIIDFFDGPLARYTNSANDRGKFVDIFSDQIMYIFAVWGLMLINIGNPLILSYNIIIIELLYFIIIIDKNETKPSDWLLHPIARANYYKLLLEFFVFWRLFFNLSLTTFNQTILILNIIVSFHFIYHLIHFIIKKDVYHRPQNYENY